MPDAATNPRSQTSNSGPRRSRTAAAAVSGHAQEPGTPPRLWSSPEVAAHLCTTVRHVRRLVDEKRIPYIKVGHFVRFDPREVENWIDSQRVAQSDLI